MGAGSPEAARVVFTTNPPTPLLSRMIRDMQVTSSDVGLARVVAEALPCDCLRDVLAEFG